MVPFQILVAVLLGWLQRDQRDVIAFRREENKTLKAQLAGRRMRLTDAQRRRIAMLGQRLGRTVLRDVATLVTPYIDPHDVDLLETGRRHAVRSLHGHLEIRDVNRAAPLGAFSVWFSYPQLFIVVAARYALMLLLIQFLNVPRHLEHLSRIDSKEETDPRIPGHPALS